MGSWTHPIIIGLLAYIAVLTTLIWVGIWNLVQWVNKH